MIFFSLDFYGLPPEVQELLQEHRGIQKLYEWQNSLMNTLCSTYNNVIYCVPTSGGKTLVAELMILKEILNNKRDALMVLPYISIVQEKMRSMLPFAEKFEFALEEYAGTKGRVPPRGRHKFK